MTDAEREHLQDTYQATEADDLLACAAWLSDVTLSPEQVHAVYVRFVGKWGHWPEIHKGAA